MKFADENLDFLANVFLCSIDSYKFVLDFTASSGTDVCHVQFFCVNISAIITIEILTCTIDSVSPIDLLLRFELQKTLRITNWQLNGFMIMLKVSQ